MDTTGSMGEEINAAKFQAREIIERRQGTPQQPDFYLLVPFHDPGEITKIVSFLVEFHFLFYCISCLLTLSPVLQLVEYS